jgi:hypothetical protein
MHRTEQIVMNPLTRAKASGVHRGRPPALKPLIRRKKPLDYETKAPPRHHRDAPESLNSSLKYHRSCSAAVASGMEARQGGDAFGSVLGSPTDPIGEGTPFALGRMRNIRVLHRREFTAVAVVRRRALTP